MNAFAAHIASRQQYAAARHVDVEIAQGWLDFCHDHEHAEYWNLDAAAQAAEVSRCMEISRARSYEALVGLAMLQHDMTRDEAELYLAVA